MQTTIPPIISASTDLLVEAKSLADLFSLELTQRLPETGLFLYFDEMGLGLHQVGEKTVVRVDFVSGSMDYRRQKGGGELIAKAVNTKQNHAVWDFTAGLGRDAFILANLGIHVTLFERNQAVAALLFDGLNRAKQEPELQMIAQRMDLIWMDVLKPETDFLGLDGEDNKRLPEVIYLDPMYPHDKKDKKSAAVKKEMAYFHQLVGQNEDASSLLSLAKKLALKRVVVKRPRLGTHLNHQIPDYVYTGKSTRFDVYMPDCLKKSSV